MHMYNRLQHIALVSVTLSLIEISTTKYYNIAQQDKAVFAAAEASCSLNSMSLPIIRTEEEGNELNDFLTESGLNADVWLGLQLPVLSTHPAHFKWCDGSPLTWSNWEGEEPDDLIWDKCVSTNPDMEWTTENCWTSKHYVCQEMAQDGTKVPWITPFPMVVGSFTRLDDFQPAGNPLVVIQTSSPIRCVAECLRLLTCDVIVLSGDGLCLLYPQAETLLPSTSTNGDCLYQRTA